ncbi:hypothetical protein [Saccharopolyspora mangrovi]|uniref:Uncharacterized protein n=1 Tax=Saccharopolyspora mangrovi TaxID=3082379 RepID=A0ABU6A5K4_9PSEU|nr:hypothetical protein [Saccharopolyspora sp. S2-29]MEB3366738.1 hypothetical protein [Saccharopolyspora sp. S2-29]
MTKQSAALAVRLRQAQWLLDELAFDAAADRLNTQQIAEAAITLSRLTTLLTIHATSSGGNAGITLGTDL